MRCLFRSSLDWDLKISLVLGDPKGAQGPVAVRAQVLVKDQGRGGRRDRQLAPALGVLAMAPVGASARSKGVARSENSPRDQGGLYLIWKGAKGASKPQA